MLFYFKFFVNILLPQISQSYDTVVRTLSPELRSVPPSLFIIILDISKHQSKVKMVESENCHQAV